MTLREQFESEYPCDEKCTSCHKVGGCNRGPDEYASWLEKHHAAEVARLTAELDAAVQTARDEIANMSCSDCKNRRGRHCTLSTVHCIRQADDYYAEAIAAQEHGRHIKVCDYCGIPIDMNGVCVNGFCKNVHKK